MNVSPVYVQVLAGDMSGALRQKKYDHGGNFLWQSHSLAQRNFAEDRCQFLFGSGNVSSHWR